MTFTIKTNHKVCLEEEIYVKLVASAEAKAERYNKMWAAREEEGKTYHTRKTFYGEEKIYWYNLTNPINDHKKDHSMQLRFDREVRSRKKYQYFGCLA